ncbi:hypothetical protein F4781DRAFT_392932 [Annulohypoxylon bovei var. microspora]|nr:hypothetical protein F4781DRAFT_392932 [Annulohypoxylon bovei var. microspora]
MPRPKKTEAARQPAPVAPAPMVPMTMQPVPAQLPQPIQQQPLAAGPGVGQPRTIGIEEFIRVRDSVHARFNTITGLMKSFSDDFLRQTNLLIGEPAPFDNGASHSMQNLIANLDGISGQFGDMGAHVEEKKERKKRTHDPNAPKRPLTPYFLYMQTARPIIANDLGQDAPKGAVQEEGQRRWASMTQQEKNAWNNAYQFNLRLYNARVHSYKAGNLDARNMSDPDALAYADANGIPQPVLSGEEAYAPNDQDAIAEQLMAIVPPEVETQTPKAKVTRKRKSAAAEVEDAEASAAKNSTPASPDKKRKRASKVADTPDEPKKSSRKKKAT